MSDRTEIVPVERKGIQIETLLSQAIDKGVSVDTMERLLAMRRELKAEAATEAYNRAMASFQDECPIIKKTKTVRTNSGTDAYSYAPIESIVKQVKSLIKKNGFSYTTRMELLAGGVKAIVRVTHELGHFEESPMEVPFGTKTAVMSGSQVAAAAQTFAKRYAFLNAFGILTGDDDNDAALTGKIAKEATETVIQLDENPRQVFDDACKKLHAQRSYEGCQTVWRSFNASIRRDDEVVAVAKEMGKKYPKPIKS